LKYINAIDTSKDWNQEDNIKRFIEIWKNMAILKEHNPHWHIKRSNAESHNPFLCHGCRKLKEEKMKYIF
jgi:hypothetical protein